MTTASDTLSKLDLTITKLTDEGIAEHKRLQTTINSLNTQISRYSEEIRSAKEHRGAYERQQKELGISKILNADSFLSSHNIFRKYRNGSLAVGLAVPGSIATYKLITGQSPDFTDLNHLWNYFYNTGNADLNIISVVGSYMALAMSLLYGVAQYSFGKDFSKITGLKLTKENAKKVKQVADYVRSKLTSE
jgi:hypothetical protein